MMAGGCRGLCGRWVWLLEGGVVSVWLLWLCYKAPGFTPVGFEVLIIRVVQIQTLTSDKYSSLRLSNLSTCNAFLFQTVDSIPARLCVVICHGSVIPSQCQCQNKTPVQPFPFRHSRCDMRVVIIVVRCGRPAAASLPISLLLLPSLTSLGGLGSADLRSSPF